MSLLLFGCVPVNWTNSYFLLWWPRIIFYCTWWAVQKGEILSASSITSSSVWSGSHPLGVDDALVFSGHAARPFPRLFVQTVLLRRSTLLLQLQHLQTQRGRSEGVKEWRSGGVKEWRSEGVKEWRSEGVKEWRSGGDGGEQNKTITIFNQENKAGLEINYFLDSKIYQSRCCFNRLCITACEQ